MFALGIIVAILHSIVCATALVGIIVNLCKRDGSEVASWFISALIYTPALVFTILCLISGI